MNPQDVKVPLNQQVELLTQVVHASPYLSREGRKELEQELLAFSEKLREEEVNHVQGEKLLGELDKRAAADEITSLMTKIGHLNPASPRLGSLREIAHRLQNAEISPDQARKAVQELMQGE